MEWECYFCGSTACPAIATDDRQDCRHCNDYAVDHEQGYVAYLDGKLYPTEASKAFEDGWCDAFTAYGPRPAHLPA